MLDLNRMNAEIKQNMTLIEAQRVKAEEEFRIKELEYKRIKDEADRKSKSEALAVELRIAEMQQKAEERRAENNAKLQRGQETANNRTEELLRQILSSRTPTRAREYIGILFWSWCK